MKKAMSLKQLKIMFFIIGLVLFLFTFLLFGFISNNFIVSGVIGLLIGIIFPPYLWGMFVDYLKVIE